jgi:hypothetical protein
MTMTVSYGAWLQEVEQALASINMPMGEWQTQWVFDFPREFRFGAASSDAAMKANRFWWHEQNKAVHQNCTLSRDCWLPRGHQGRCQPVTQGAFGAQP